MIASARYPRIGECVLYDNGGRDIGEAGAVERVIGYNIVIVAGEERNVRYIADGVWCINGPIGPNQNATRLRTFSL